MLFDNTFDVFGFEQFLTEKRRLAGSSMYVYVRMIERFLVNGYDPLNIDDYNKFIIKHAIKKRAVHVYSILKAFIEYKIDDAGTRATMIDALIKPEIPSTSKYERKYLDEKQIIELINNLKFLRHRIVALIQDLTGVRSGDVFRIRRGDVIPEIFEDKAVLKIIITGKREKRNVVYIHDEIVQVLIMDFIVKNYIHDEYYFMDNLLRNKNNRNAEYRNMISNYRKYYRDLKQSMYKVGVDMKDFATHDYRRCYARRVWTKYKDLHVLQELLNHSNPVTTMKYLKHSGLQNVAYHKEMQSR